MKPNYKVRRFRHYWQDFIEISINPGVAKFPRFKISFNELGPYSHRIEGFPYVRGQKQYKAYKELWENGLHQWLSLIDVFISFQHPDDLIGWLQGSEVIVGNGIYTFNSICGSPVLRVFENTQDGSREEDCWESRTYTFYTITTFNGSITIRWMGESNGYYSEAVSCVLKGFS